MIKYEVFDYELWGNEEEGYTVKDVVPTGLTLFTDTSKSSISSICKKLGLNDPYRIYVCVRKDSIYIDYDGNPYCELRKIN